MTSSASSSIVKELPNFKSPAGIPRCDLGEFGPVTSNAYRKMDSSKCQGCGISIVPKQDQIPPPHVVLNDSPLSKQSPLLSGASDIELGSYYGNFTDGKVFNKITFYDATKGIAMSVRSIGEIPVAFCENISGHRSLSSNRKSTSSNKDDIQCFLRNNREQMWTKLVNGAFNVLKERISYAFSDKLSKIHTLSQISEKIQYLTNLFQARSFATDDASSINYFPYKMHKNESFGGQEMEKA